MSTSNEHYAQMLDQLSVEDLETFAHLVETALRKKQQPGYPKPKTVHFNPFEHFDREGSGWTMQVKGFDEQIAGWAAFEGTLMKGCREHYQLGTLYLDLGMKGQSETYTFFQVDNEGKPVIIKTMLAEDFGPELFGLIEKYL